jgi:integrase
MARRTKLKTVDRNIYVRGDSFQVKLKSGDTWVTETFDTLEDARAFRDTKRSRAALDPTKRLVLKVRVAKRDAKEQTVAKLLVRYRDEILTDPKRKGGAKEFSRVDVLLRHAIAQQSIFSVTPEDVDTLMDDLRAGRVTGQKGPISGSTLLRYTARLSHFFKTAQTRWKIQVENPVREIEKAKPNPPRRRRLEGREEAQICASLANATSLYALPAYLFSVEVALRKGELERLEWRYLDIEEATIHISKTKNGEARDVALTPPAETILRSLPKKTVLDEEGKEKEDPRIFPITSGQLRGAFDAAVSVNAISNLRWHDMRREGTSRLFEDYELDPVGVSEVTGHKTLQVLKAHYSKPRAKALAARMRRAQQPAAENRDREALLIVKRCEFVEAVLKEHYQSHVDRTRTRLKKTRKDAES